MNKLHIIQLRVRDYECDMQSVVNNGVYQNYLEHARHEYLLEHGIDFARLAAQGINLVVVRAEIDYRGSLLSQDKFEVRSSVQKISKLRFEFLQDIYRIPDQRLMLKARIIATSLNPKGRPYVADFLTALFDD